LFLVDVLLEDIAEDVGVDFVVGAERSFVEMPLVLVEVVEDELLAGRFPAEFFDEELGQVAALQERAGAWEVEWHRSVFADSEGANNPWFAGLDIVLGHAQTVFLVEREDQIDERFDISAGLHLAVEEVTGGLGQRCFIDGINGLMERLDVEETALHLVGVVLEPFVCAPAGAGGFA
jgi:hypothetical protein